MEPVTRYSLRIDRPIGLVTPKDPPMWRTALTDARAEVSQAQVLAAPIGTATQEALRALDRAIVQSSTFAQVVENELAAFERDSATNQLADFDRVQRLTDMQVLYASQRAELEAASAAALAAVAAAIDVAATPTPLPAPEELLVRQELDLLRGVGGAEALASAAARDNRAATVLVGSYGDALSADDTFGIGALAIPAARARLASHGEPRVRAALTAGPNVLALANEAHGLAAWAVHAVGRPLH